MTRPKSRFDWPLFYHWKEHIKTFDLILHGSKTDEKRRRYGQSRKNWFDTLAMGKTSPFWTNVRTQSLLNSPRVGLQVWNFKEETLATMCNSQIAKSFSSQAGILIGKWLLIMKITLVISVCKVVAHRPKLDSSRDLWHSKEDIMTFPETPKNIKNQHRELRQPCVGKLTKVWRLC